MKKIFLLLCLTALVSCGKNEKSQKILINAMAYGDNSNQEGINWGRLVKEFQEANSNIEIQSELLYDEAYHQKVTARLASGDIPDLAYMGVDARWGAPWQNADQQWDHREFIDADYYDMSLIPPHGPNGEVYEIPIGTSNITTVLFMNTKLLQSLGLSKPETYEDFVAMVPVAKEAGVEVITIDGADGWALGSCLLSVFIGRTSGNKTWVSEAMAGQHKFNDPEFVAALDLVRRLVDDGVFSQKVALIDYGTNISNFNNNKALFMVQGQWAAGGIEDPELAETMELIAWPTLPGQSPGVENSVAAAISVGYGLTKVGGNKPDVRDAGLEFIRYFNSPAEAEQRLRDGAIVAPILKNFTLPEDLPNAVIQKVALANSALETEVIDAFLAGKANENLMEGVQKILVGQATPEEVADAIEAAVQR